MEDPTERMRSAGDEQPLLAAPSSASSRGLFHLSSLSRGARSVQGGLDRMKSLGRESLQSMRDSSPVPPLQLVSICVTQASQAIQITLPYTLAVFVVRDFGYETEELVSQKTGLLASYFCLAMFLTAFFWGKFSDTYGRKPVIVIGNLASVISVVGFGLASTYGQACAVRFFGGFCNGILGAVKTVLGESCSSEHQGPALLFLSISWGVGTTIGPTIGGLLARPCSKSEAMPFCGEGELFQAKPYLLPCLVTGLLSLVAFFMSIFCMTETLKKDTDLSPTPAGKAEGAHLAEGAGNGLTRVGSIGKIRAWMSARRETPSQRRKDLHEIGLAEIDGTAIRPSCSQPSSTSSLSPGRDLEGAKLCQVEEAPVGADSTQTRVPPEADSSPKTEPESDHTNHEVSIQLVESSEDNQQGEADGNLPWWKYSRVNLTLLGYGLVAFTYNMSDEVTPIYASAPPPQGGLGFSTSQVGVPLAVGGISLLLFATLGFKQFQKYFGVQRLAFVSLFWAVPVWVCIPFATFFLPNVTLAMVVICLAHVGKSVAGSCTFTSSMVMVNVAAPTKQLGQVNGMGQSVAALVRGLGPALGGYLWSLSLSTGLPWHQYMLYTGLAVSSVLTSVVYSQKLLRIPGLD